MFPGVSSLNTSGVRLQIFDGFYFLFGHWLKVRQRWYTKTFSGISRACLQSYTCAWRSWFPEYVRVLWRLYVHSFPTFSCKIFDQLFIYSNYIIASGSHNIKQFLVIVFEKCSEKRPHGKKEILQVRVPMKLRDRSNNDSSVERGLGGNPKFFLHLLVAARLLVFMAIMNERLLIFKTTEELGNKGWKKHKLTCPKLTILTEIQVFFIE